MNKINAVGSKLIDYRKEFHKDYPQLIKDSLTLALEQMMSDSVLDLTTYELIKDTKIKDDDFSDYLLTRKEYSKTEEEIRKEIDIVRNRFDEELKDANLLGLISETIVERETVLISKIFTIDEKFVMNYFGIEEKDLVKLMKKRGFIEKFAVLRMTKIMGDIVVKLNDVEPITIDTSLVYFNKTEDGFNIDLTMEIKAEELEKEERKELIEKIEEIVKISDAIYNNAMSC